MTKLPAEDLERARAYYPDRFGLEPVEERTGGLRSVCGPTEFQLFGSSGVPSRTSTQMAFEVENLEATPSDLRARRPTLQRCWSGGTHERPGLERSIERAAAGAAGGIVS